MKKNDASLHSLRSNYKNAHMLESGGKVFLGLGLVIMPLGLLSDLASLNEISLSGGPKRQSHAKGVFYAGVFVGAIGVLSWTIGSTKKNRIVDNYFKEQYGLNDNSQKPIGTLSTNRNGLQFNYSF